MPLNPIKLTLTQIYLDSTFYGCFAMLFTVSQVLINNRLRSLASRRKRGLKVDENAEDQEQILRFWSLLGWIMFCVISIHWLFLWITAMYFGLYDRVVLGKLSFARLVIEMMSILVGDALVLSRLWIIANRRIAALLFPFLCFLGFIACALRLLILEVPVLLKGIRLPNNGTKEMFIAVTVLTACVNIYSTGLIIIKAQSMKVSLKTAGDKFMHILSIMVESAAIYTLWIIILVGCVIKDRALWSYLLPVSPSLYGCVMVLISVRLGLGWAMGLGGQTPVEHKSVVMQFARSEHSDDSYL